MQELLEASKPLSVFQRNFAGLKKRTFSDLDNELFRTLQYSHLLEQQLE